MAGTDVGDESWGIVGLFDKQAYTDMHTDLKSLLTDMQEGVQSASDKIGTAAKHCRDAEDGHQRVLSEVTETLESTVVKNIQA
ncbi:hypothetical protein [Saccharomonospora saliphila]|uniref:hypothetical protein n=1 Tax=Saccharomonospora saliphila TaxID=369829 RepID=UPI000367B809|nr:hypothetical protein [Saccharomonospora saliphila]